MTPAFVNLPIPPDRWYYSGDTFPEAKFAIKDTSTNLPLNLTGYIAKMDWVRSDGTVARSFTSSDNSLTINAELGEIVINSFILNLPEGLYKYDLQISNPSETKTLVRGNVRIKDDITK